MIDFRLIQLALVPHADSHWSPTGRISPLSCSSACNEKYTNGTTHRRNPLLNEVPTVLLKYPPIHILQARQLIATKGLTSKPVGFMQSCADDVQMMSGRHMSSASRNLQQSLTLVSSTNGTAQMHYNGYSTGWERLIQTLLIRSST